MGTRSIIAKRLEGGTIKAIYCHWDGYPEHNGYILNRYYKSEEDIDKLLELGDISSLGATPYDTGDFDSFPERLNDSIGSYSKCVSYRSRGETGIDARIYKGVREACDRMSDTEYVYVFEPKLNRWTAFDTGRLTNEIDLNKVVEIIDANAKKRADDRIKSLFYNVIEYIRESVGDEAEAYAILTDSIGLTETQIDRIVNDSKDGTDDEYIFIPD